MKHDSNILIHDFYVFCLFKNIFKGQVSYKGEKKLDMKLQQGYFMLQNNEVLFKKQNKTTLDYKLNVFHPAELSSIGHTLYTCKISENVCPMNLLE